MKNTFWKRERIEIMIALALFNYVFLGAEYLFDNMMLIYVLVMARKLMKECWFEKAIFTWGWFTGTMAMGIALLRVADPKMRSRCLDNYALAYLFIAPVEISLITFAPVAFLNGYGLVFTGICLAAGLAVLATAYIKGWFIRKQ